MLQHFLFEFFSKLCLFIYFICRSNPDILADKSVQTEYLRCGSGKIRWHHPEGAVSIKIELPQYSLPKPSTSKKTEHRLCLSVDFATVKGVNLYLQDREAMTLLYTTGKRQVAPETGWITAAPSNSESDSIQNRCFPLSGRFAVLFLEHFFDSTNLVSISADKIPENEPIYSRLPSTGVAKIDYDIQAYN